MSKSLLLILLSYCFIATIQAQESSPHLSGSVKISILEGTFECDLAVSNIPPLSNYYIRLNSGMNILHFQALQPDTFLISYEWGTEDKMSTGESRAYYFADNTGESKFLPQKIRVKYVGKFPVVNDTLGGVANADWKGNIAFNGYSVRTDGFQTAWYPYLYDFDNDIAYSKVSYDLQVECLDCNTLYVNGNAPLVANTGRLKSEIPYDLALFCGNYEIAENEDFILLNSSLNSTQLDTISTFVNSIKSYYEQQIGITFSEPPTFIATTPTSQYNAWFFVTYPSIFGIGWGNFGFNRIVEYSNKSWFQQFISHELGHYYFGTHKVFNSPLGDLMSEGFAEFLSLKMMQQLDTTFYKQQIQEKLDFTKSFKTLPLQKIKSHADIKDRETFVYDYAPLLFLAIEKEIGSDKMWEWIKIILNSEEAYTDFQFLKSTFSETLQSSARSEQLFRKYFVNKKSMKSIQKVLR